MFAKYCRSCHGAEGKGDGAGAPKDVHPANLTDAKWDHGSTDGEIFTTIKMGVGPKFDMDSWDGRIKDPDIWNLVNYIRTLGPKDSAAKCKPCHRFSLTTSLACIPPFAIGPAERFPIAGLIIGARAHARVVPGIGLLELGLALEVPRPVV